MELEKKMIRMGKESRDTLSESVFFRLCQSLDILGEL
jgi:hypothetical protein